MAAKPRKLDVMAELIRCAAGGKATNEELQTLALQLKGRLNGKRSKTPAGQNPETIPGRRLALIRACLADNPDRVEIQSLGKSLLKTLKTPKNIEEYDSPEAHALVRSTYLTDEAIRNAQSVMTVLQPVDVAAETNEPTISSSDRQKSPKAPLDDEKLKTIAVQLEADGYFDQSNKEDACNRVMREIVERRGQPQFRADLIEAYGKKCAVTGCTVLSVLEAAHIVPYREHGEQTHTVINGLLLRADIHTLFDQYLLGINPDDGIITIATSALSDTYKEYDGKPLRPPQYDIQKPATKLLRMRWDEFCKRNGAR